MKVLLIYASRYGSTKQIAEYIADSLTNGGMAVNIADVNDSPDLSADVILLGSGIYAHKFLPEMEQYIKNNRDALLNTRVGLFGVAMRTDVIHKKGRSFGGELILDKYELNPFVKCMLHGRRDFSILTEKDRGGLERFYDSIGLTEEQKAERRCYKDEVSQDECSQFAGEVIRILTIDES